MALMVYWKIMRTASKTVKRHSFIRRIFPAKMSGFSRPETAGLHEQTDKSSATPAGFTIIETLIVLAVTAGLFILAATQINGKQEETEFQQAINDASSSLQQEITTVTSGDYTGPQQLNCDNTGGTVNITNYTGPNQDNEGTSSNCVFVGKDLAFFQSVGSNNNRQFYTYPIAGLRSDGSGNQCTTISCVMPILVAPDNGVATGTTLNNFPDDGVATTLLYGLTIKTINYVKNGSVVSGVGGFAVMSSLGTSPGSQQFYLVPLLGTTPGHNSYVTSDTGNGRPLAVSWINSNLKQSYNTALNLMSSASDYSVQICLASGTTNQSGLIQVGGNGGDVNAVTTTLFNSNNCT